MATGTTTDHTLSRNQIITLATQKVGGLAQGDPLSAAQLADGILTLNNIIRELDMKDNNIWAIPPDPSHLTLVANQYRYVTGGTATTIPTNLLELINVSYRNEQAEDHPLFIANALDYERIQNKLEQGDPQLVYLQPHATLASQVLFVHPMPAAVNTQSVVTGTDAAAYRCIRTHTADSTNRPITGANWQLFWELGGSGPAAWASGAQYSAPQQLRFKFKRPLWDFDLSTDNADMPQAFGRYLVYATAFDLADDYTLDLEERTHLARKAAIAYATVFGKAHVPKTNTHYNRARDF